MVYSILEIILCESKGITLGNIINDEKKELIKENLKIKNQLQMVSTQYENMKRIHDSLLDEYLDLQVNNNFDKNIEYCKVVLESINDFEKEYENEIVIALKGVILSTIKMFDTLIEEKIKELEKLL